MDVGEEARGRAVDAGGGLEIERLGGGCGGG